MTIKHITRVEVNAIGEPSTIGVLLRKDDDAAVASEGEFLGFLIMAV